MLPNFAQLEAAVGQFKTAAATMVDAQAKKTKARADLVAANEEAARLTAAAEAQLEAAANAEAAASQGVQASQAAVVAAMAAALEAPTGPDNVE